MLPKLQLIKVNINMNTEHQDISNTLKERGSRYGKFSGHAKISQSIKEIMHLSLNWEALQPDQKEALEMVAHKIGRILNGDPSYVDSWYDIEGYVRLVRERLAHGQQP